MQALRKLFDIAISILTIVRHLLGWLLRGLFGELNWQAPSWLKALGAHIATSGRFLNAHRRATAATCVALVLLGIGGHQAWKWWESRPRPQEVDFAITEPRLTDFANEGKPNPLALRFDADVAPLVMVGKPVEAGLTMKPAIKGSWHWQSSNELVFTPAEEWAVGTPYAVTLDRKILLPAHVRLARDDFEFLAPAFVIRSSRKEFYQDPVDPVAKKAVFEFAFTHPVNKAEFEKRIELQLAGAKEGVWGIGRESTRFTVSYDKFGLEAYVHSEPLPAPQDDSKITLTLAPGAHAQLGGKAFAGDMQQHIAVPGRNSLKIQGLSTTIAQDSKGDPEQILMVRISATTTEKAIAQATSAWVLPEHHPDSKPEARKTPHAWHDSADITDAVLAKSTRLPLTLIPGEREHNEQHAFRFEAPVGRYIYVQVEKGLESFGGYLLAKRAQRTLLIQPFPPQLAILGEGALLSMSGEKKLVVVTRDVPGLEVELGRVLPAQLQHLVTQADGNFSQPSFNGAFGMDNLAERYEYKQPVAAASKPGRAQYTPIDLGSYLKQDGGDKRGIFLVRVRGHDPASEQVGQPSRNAEPEVRPQEEENSGEEGEEGEESSEEDYGAESNHDPRNLQDARLVLITDLGILVKRSLDGTQDVFVQSIASGKPVSGAQVEVIGRNGLSLMSRSTDSDGRVQFARLEGLARERAPVMYLVRKDGDMSFLPLSRHDRSLDFSRFDVGGIRNTLSPGQLTAHLFSDRGIYRPGDAFHIGIIVKAHNWANTPVGLPLEVEVTDPRGLPVKRDKLQVGNAGFSEFSHTTTEASPTGTYMVNLYLTGNDGQQRLLGSTSVNVQEFLPDRMKVKTSLSAEPADGWIHPKDLAARVDVQNLFGTPAPNRRVQASMTLSPSFPAFSAYPDYQFFDPLYAKRSFTDQLDETSTDDSGLAQLPLNLDRFERATYRLYLVASAFEPEGGRSVSGDVSALVSEMEYMVGYKPDGDLGYVSRGAKRIVSLLAIDPKAKRTALQGLRLERVERRFVSVLARQPNGTYKYESRPKEVPLQEQDFEIPAGGRQLTLESTTPGNFFYRVRNRDGQQLARIEYSVAGDANVTRSLERNAELQIAVKNRNVSPGEEIELSIRAPYTGSGLITIERERVYAHQWFSTSTQSSVQKIRLPADFEGNGYVTVQFIRNPASEEIFMSPLSWGTVPFQVNLDRRTNKLRIEAPQKVKPGETLRMKLVSTQPTRAVVFAVDEGILQVARYKLANPLDHFFQKRALDVRTAQILDLILPEFRQLMQAAAPGGDEEGALARNLNPFKRKRDKPAVYWSGIVDVTGEREFTYEVPDTFNGSLRLMAVAVNDGAIGTASGNSTVQGDFVLLPNAPLAVAPGDEFELSVGVANNVAGAGKDAPVALTLQGSPHFELLDAATQNLKINERSEGVARFRVRARQGAQGRLGSGTLTLSATLSDPKLPGKSARLATDVSVRPATPYYTQLRVGRFKRSTELDIQRDLFSEHRKSEAGISPLPLILADGLAAYLGNFSHLCTEQLTSKAMPSVILGQRPEFASARQDAATTRRAFEDALRTLRTRQNAEGGFGLWTASVEADEYASVYVIHMLIEAHERGLPVPPDMLQKSLRWLNQLAVSPASELHEARTRAYAIYLLTRQGNVTSGPLAQLRQSLEAHFKDSWPNDSTATYMAASYRLMKDERQAGALIDARLRALTRPGEWTGWFHYYDPLVRDAQTLFIVSRHFPERARKISFEALSDALKALEGGRYNTHSAAYLILALDAYANAIGNQTALNLAIQEIDAQGKSTPSAAPSGLILRHNVSPAAKKLRLSSDSDLSIYYAASETGFDRTPPTRELKQGMEVVREYLDAGGKVVQSAKVGDELTVRLRFRAIERGDIYNAVLVDLLPGGFEPVLGNSPSAAGWSDRLARGGNWQPEYGDVREERVVLYGTVGSSMGEYQYRIRATNAGTFIVPPAYGESLYERDVQARSLPASLRVEAVR